MTATGICHAPLSEDQSRLLAVLTEVCDDRTYWAVLRALEGNLLPVAEVLRRCGPPGTKGWWSDG